MTLTREDITLLMEAAQAGLLKKLTPARNRISLTGKLSMKRADMVKLIRAVGGFYDEHPTVWTNYLIVGDTSVHGYTHKMAEAEDRGTTIISESDFVKMIARS